MDYESLEMGVKLRNRHFKMAQTLTMYKASLLVRHFDSVDYGLGQTDCCQNGLLEI